MNTTKTKSPGDETQEAIMEVNVPYDLAGLPNDVNQVIVNRDGGHFGTEPVMYTRRKNPDGSTSAFVKDGLKVSAEAYLGPEVVVLGTRTAITGEPRITGKVFINNAIVSGNATIEGGEIYLERGVMISDDAQIKVSEGSKLNLFDLAVNKNGYIEVPNKPNTKVRAIFRKGKVETISDDTGWENAKFLEDKSSGEYRYHETVI